MVSVDEAQKKAFKNSADAGTESYAKAFLSAILEKNAEIVVKLGTTLEAYYDKTRMFIRKDLVSDHDLETALYLCTIMELQVLGAADGSLETAVNLRSKRFVASKLTGFLQPHDCVGATTLNKDEPDVPSKKRRISNNNDKLNVVEIIDVDLLDIHEDIAAKEEENLELNAFAQVPHMQTTQFEQISVSTEGKCHLTVLTPLCLSGNQESVSITTQVGTRPQHLGNIVKAIDLDGNGGIMVTKTKDRRMVFSLIVIPQEQEVKVTQEVTPKNCFE